MLTKDDQGKSMFICDFCARTEYIVKYLIGSELMRPVHICGECVDGCAQIIKEQLAASKPSN